MERLSTAQKWGLGLAILISVISLPSAFVPTSGDQAGPPFAVLLADTLLAAVAIVAAIIAWRRLNAIALRITAGALIIGMLTVVPAFFVSGVDSSLVVVAAVDVLINIVAVVLMFAGPRTRTAAESA